MAQTPCIGRPEIHTMHSGKSGLKRLRNNARNTHPIIQNILLWKQKSTQTMMFLLPNCLLALFVYEGAAKASRCDLACTRTMNQEASKMKMAALHKRARLQIGKMMSFLRSGSLCTIREVTTNDRLIDRSQRSHTGLVSHRLILAYSVQSEADWIPHINVHANNIATGIC